MLEQKRKIMLVDDNIISMMVTADILTAHGYLVVQTTSPNGCIAKLDYEEPDVLLLDIDMPRLAVEDIVRSVRQTKEHVNLMVVLFSNRSPEEMASLCATKELHGYFSKKMDVTRLPEYIGYFF
jgi:CheY-like chemotaxis protein